MNNKACKSEDPHEEATFSCATCEKRFLEGFKASDNDLSSCRECGRKPSCKISLSKTKRDRSGRLYGCDTCGKKLKVKYNLLEHFRVHTGERNYGCNVCGKKFRYKGYLNVHRRVHTGERKYTCETCGKGFLTKSNLLAHVRVHDTSRIDASKRKLRKIPCELCGAVFKSLSGHSSHKKIHETGMSFSDSIREKYKDCRDIVDIVKGVFICKLCGRNYKSKSDFQKHANRHGEKRYVCEYCGKRFHGANILSVHLTIHTGDRKFSCGDCGKRFSQKSHLRVHARTHTGEKKFVCGECGKGFNGKTHLKDHIRMHTGEKNYTCDVCGWAFIQKSGLTSHVKNYSCRLSRIGKKVPNKNNNGVSDSFECNICQKMFDNKVLLIEHCYDHKDQRDPVVERLALEDISNPGSQKIEEMLVSPDIKLLDNLTSETVSVSESGTPSPDTQNLVSGITTDSNTHSSNLNSDVLVKIEIDSLETLMN